ncbi:MAG: signal peptidase I [Dehalococcoidia bacterium]
MGRAFSDILKSLVLAAALFFVIQALVQNYQVFGASMEPSMHSGERIIVNKAAYLSVDLGKLSKFIPFYDKADGSRVHLFGEPQRGDVVIVESPNPPPDRLIKRIVGIPGDTVEIRSGTLYINGHPIEEPYVQGSTSILCRNGVEYPYDVLEDSYFIMGDNRTHSNDSRCLGPISRSDIVGKAWMAYWPLGDIGIVDSHAIEVPSDP